MVGDDDQTPTLFGYFDEKEPDRGAVFKVERAATFVGVERLDLLGVAVMCRQGTSTLVGTTCTGRLRSPRRELARRLGWRANIVAAQRRSRSVSSEP